MSFLDFKLDLARAITEQLVEHFNSIGQSELSIDRVSEAGNMPGVYMLYHQSRLVYVGKSDSNLRGRLERHYKSICGRLNIAVKNISFKAIRLDKNWSALTTESALIEHYDQPDWNNSGFGSNDPGRRRDSTVLKPDSFDARYPINTQLKLTVPVGQYTSWELLNHIKQELPYLLRFKKDGCRKILTKTQVDVLSGNQTVEDLIILVAKSLGENWQATALAGRILLYPEKVKYEYGIILWPSRNVS